MLTSAFPKVGGEFKLGWKGTDTYLLTYVQNFLGRTHGKWLAVRRHHEAASEAGSLPCILSSLFEACKYLTIEQQNPVVS